MKELGACALAVCIAPVALAGVVVFFVLLAIGKLVGVEYVDYPDAKPFTRHGN